MNVIKSILLLLLISAVSCTQTGQNKNASSVPQKSSVNEPVAGGRDFFEASLNGDLEKVTEILNQDMDVNLADKDNRTALMFASFNGNHEIVNLLLNKGANINLMDVNNRTALMFAASGPYPETVKLLLEHGADPNMTDLPEHFTALMYAAAEGQLEVVKVLLQNRADPSMKDVDGDNALVFAQNNGHTAVVEYLKSIEKSVESKD